MINEDLGTKQDVAIHFVAARIVTYFCECQEVKLKADLVILHLY